MSKFLPLCFSSLGHGGFQPPNPPPWLRHWPMSIKLCTRSGHRKREARSPKGPLVGSRGKAPVGVQGAKPPEALVF